ncbi:DUF397 domain-containing protein [Streptomyces subrutilus]|uniref:DUF397 domain-containing protein n=1 Tax=Streptomyces subrutilus TaxID=36818 RepID=A0A1E5PSI1_9ACTN|nr:DUF397 domain-containing protein [Streptomyces subrutilus]OEJ32470.1 DUF397 domain-containing protein [Streptomyces subrutilus]
MSTALEWFKSSHSSPDGDKCVEVAICAIQIHVRDSKAKDGPTLALAPAAWADLTAWAGSGS